MPRRSARRSWESTSVWSVPHRNGGARAPRLARRGPRRAVHAHHVRLAPAHDPGGHPGTAALRPGTGPAGGVPLDILALNDVVSEKLTRDRQANIAVFVNGKHFASYSADAVIVSTPTPVTVMRYRDRPTVTSTGQTTGGWSSRPAVGRHRGRVAACRCRASWPCRGCADRLLRAPGPSACSPV